MASIIGKGIGSITNKLVDLESGRVFTSPLNKLWRTKILLNRATSPMPKDNSISTSGDFINHHYARENSLSIAESSNKWSSSRRVAMSTGKSPIISTDYTKINHSNSQEINNQIIIINKNVSPPISIVIQNRPNELSVNPQSYWVSVKSMGRNNPFMMYTGGEDTISFDISWYVSDPNNREEVIAKCKLLESWTKANGYLYAPPTLNILWGTSGLFDNDLFILESAPYTLTHFQNAVKTSPYKHTQYGQRVPDADYSVTDLKLLPNFATQSLTFKRVSPSNRTHLDIIPEELLKKTKGISFQTDTGNNI